MKIASDKLMKFSKQNNKKNSLVCIFVLQSVFLDFRNDKQSFPVQFVRERQANNPKYFSC